MIFSSPVWGSGGQCSASCVLRVSVRSVTAEVLKIMSPDFMQIFVMCAVCAEKVMVVPPIILDFL